MPTVYVAPEGFMKELKTELARLGGAAAEERGRLLISREPAKDLAWAQDTWTDVREIDVDSIGDAAKKLRAIGGHWWLESTALHRRASLIQEKLPRASAKAIGFLDPLPERRLGAWTLLDEKHLLASPETLHPLPGGEVPLKENKTDPPSRAYMKLWELFTVYGVRPRPGAKCLELGASPGGWTWVLAGLGCEVSAIDRSPLDPRIARMKGVSFKAGDALSLDPKAIGRIDWLFSDVICQPAKLFETVRAWRESGLCRNFVCTLKFKGETDFDATDLFRAVEGSKVKHLWHNKHELTWWLTSGD